jgi:hypothetical protein
MSKVISCYGSEVGFSNTLGIAKKILRTLDSVPGDKVIKSHHMLLFRVTRVRAVCLFAFFCRSRSSFESYPIAR